MEISVAGRITVMDNTVAGGSGEDLCLLTTEIIALLNRQCVGVVQKVHYQQLPEP